MTLAKATLRRALALGSALACVALVSSLPAAPARKPASRPRLPKGYAEAVKRWHARDADATRPRTADGKPLVVLEILNTGERVELPAGRDDGGYAASDLDRAAHALRDPRTGDEHPTDPRLLDVVTALVLHFDAPSVRVVSGYRTPKANGRSFHGRGRAIDLIVPGASDTDVATYARSLGFVGVGIYPTSGFVHVDSRPHSYFWVDPSGPGQRTRVSGILGALANESDAKAKARGARAPAAPTPPREGCENEPARAPDAPPTEAADDEDDEPPGGG